MFASFGLLYLLKVILDTTGNIQMRRDRILKAVNSLRDALQAAQIRELLRAARNGQQMEGVNRTQKILLAYNVFMRHYQDFEEDEKDMMNFFGLTPLLDIAFWSFPLLLQLHVHSGLGTPAGLCLDPQP